ncbi:MAG: YncE family protein [Ferruginibacter sp.]
MNTLKTLLLTSCMLAFFSVAAQSKKYVLILAKGEQKMVVLDYESLDSITKIPVGEDPHEVVTNDSGTLAYVSVPILNGKGHEINIINLQTLQPEKSFDTKPLYTPHGLAYINDKLWFTAQGSKAVGIYNPHSGQTEQVLGTGQDFTHLIYVKPDGSTFYSTNVESGTVSIYEKKEIPPYMPPTGVLPANAKPRTEWRQTLVNVGFGAEGFDLSPDGKELWTARPDGHIIIVDTEAKKVKAGINTNTPGFHRLKFTPDGKTVCIVSVKTGDLLYYNSRTRQQEQKVHIGQSAGIYMDAPSNRMFISCTPNNDVVVIDLASRKEIRRLAISRPDGITAVVVKE